MENYKVVKFGSLPLYGKFECYGDMHLNYNYPKICSCIKISEETGEEIDGITFGMNEDDKVFILIK